MDNPISSKPIDQLIEDVGNDKYNIGDKIPLSEDGSYTLTITQKMIDAAKKYKDDPMRSVYFFDAMYDGFRYDRDTCAKRHVDDLNEAAKEVQNGQTPSMKAGVFVEAMMQTYDAIMVYVAKSDIDDPDELYRKLWKNTIVTPNGKYNVDDFVRVAGEPALHNIIKHRGDKTVPELSRYSNYYYTWLFLYYDHKYGDMPKHEFDDQHDKMIWWNSSRSVMVESINHDNDSNTNDV